MWLLFYRNTQKKWVILLLRNPLPMLIKPFAVIALLCTFNYATAQILGGGTQFSNAVLFNSSWLSGCPLAPTTLSNQLPFEPTTAIDPCAPAPLCATGTPIADVWFSFFAQSTTARIVINPDAFFNVAIQAFSGSTCPGLTDIGCRDAGGTGITETLELTGLTINQQYYFRIFGASADVSNRTGTGTYNFCGSSQLGSAILAVTISNFSAAKQNGAVQLKWVTQSESGNAYFEIERSSNGNNYQSIGRVNGAGTTSSAMHYNFDDANPLSAAVNYYRLKEVAANGSYQYSNIVTVRPDNNLQKRITILSNPVTDNLNVRISSDEMAAMALKVIDHLGRVVYLQNDTVVKGDNIFTVAGSRLHYSGGEIYILQVSINNEIWNTRFVSGN